MGHGWAPAPGETRQKDRTKTKERAKRLRRELTSSEKRLRRLLREIPGAHFRTQVALDDYVFDFGDFGSRVLIELDGGIHTLPEVREWDARKEAHAVAAGFKVLRFTNAEVWGREGWVIDQVRARVHAPHPPAPAPQGGGGEESSEQ